jgi:structure-specific recognition protein 1
MYIPPDAEADPADKEAETAAELLQQQIMNAANIRKNAATGDVLLVSFDPSKGAFLTPRGRYGIELYDTYLRMRGQKYDYKIRYDDINRLFLLPKPDEVHMAFVIALDKPIRQGNQRYQYLVMQASKEPDEVVVNMDEEALEREYKGELQPVMRGSLSNLIAKTFKVIADKKVFIPGKFANANQQASLSCSVRANEGLLYPLEKQFVFIHKPPIIVRFNEIDSVEFQRYAGGQGSTRNFDLCVNLKSSVVAGGGVKDYTFSGIDRSDYPGLYSFLSGKKIPIKNLEQGFSMDDGNKVAKKPVYNEDEIFGRVAADDDGADDEEESDDESYGKEDAAKDEGPGSEDDEDDDSDEVDDDDLGSEVDEDLDSDLEEARSGTKRKSGEKSSSKAKKSKKSADSDDDNDDDDEESPKKKVTKKAKKDANAPKRGMTAYFMFMNENRSRIKQENPDAPFGEIVRELSSVLLVFLHLQSPQHCFKNLG